MPLSSPE